MAFTNTLCSYPQRFISVTALSFGDEARAVNANISSDSKSQVSEVSRYPRTPSLSQNNRNLSSFAARTTTPIPAFRPPAPSMQSVTQKQSKTEDTTETAVPRQTGFQTLGNFASQAESSSSFTFPSIRPPDHSPDSMPGGPSAPSLFLSERAAPSPYDSHQAMNRDSCDQVTRMKRTDDVADTELAADGIWSPSASHSAFWDPLPSCAGQRTLHSPTRIPGETHGMTDNPDHEFTGADYQAVIDLPFLSLRTTKPIHAEYGVTDANDLGFTADGHRDEYIRLSTVGARADNVQNPLPLWTMQWPLDFSALRESESVGGQGQFASDGAPDGERRPEEWTTADEQRFVERDTANNEVMVSLPSLFRTAAYTGCQCSITRKHAPRTEVIDGRTVPRRPKCYADGRLFIEDVNDCTSIVHCGKAGCDKSDKVTSPSNRQWQILNIWGCMRDHLRVALTQDHAQGLTWRKAHNTCHKCSPAHLSNLSGQNDGNWPIYCPNFRKKERRAAQRGVEVRIRPSMHHHSSENEPVIENAFGDDECQQTGMQSNGGD